LSIKTGGCPEDCSYCSQAARYHTNVKVQKLLPYAEVIQAAVRAQENGSSRFCMGAAWREVRDNKDFDRVLDMVKGVNSLGMEVCCTLGMLSEDQAQKLKDAGLYAYNHNIDTSEEYYDDLDKLIDWYELNKNIGSASEVKHRAKEKDGATYVGASKDEIKTINNFNEKDEIIDLSKEAEKAGGELSMKDIIKLHGL
jgi:biotin synthase